MENTAVHAQIAEIRARVEGHDDDIARIDRVVSQHNEAISSLRESLARVATKDDIAEFRKDVGQKFDKQLTDALSSVPGKHAAIFGAGMFLIALIGLVVNLMHGHG
jgi:hypothetical protein